MTPIPSSPHYGVDHVGRVYRLPGKNCRRLRLLTPYYRRGRLSVKICHEGRIVRRFVHQLVAEAFIGPRPTGAVVNHKNSVPVDNHFRNLEYVTPLQNTRHMMNRGRSGAVCGEKHYASKLTDEQRRYVREQSETRSYRSLAEELGVSVTTIHNIVKKGLT